MKLILATGIYPPDIGGPATYVRSLADELHRRGEEVIVVTYGAESPKTKVPTSAPRGGATAGRQRPNEPWKIVRISKAIPIIRWIRYAMALRKYGTDANAVIAFSSISCGVPLMLARLKKPKKILRLGGDFFWERFTDHGGNLSLTDWYRRSSFSKKIMQKILSFFDHIVFSTHFQEELYEKSYKTLPTHSVIENAFPSKQQLSQPMRLLRTGGLKGNAIRLLFLGRFVRFKNIPALLQGVSNLRRNGQCRVTLRIVGDGPEESHYRTLIRNLGISDCVTLHSSAHGEDKQRLFAEHDLLIIPSLTEISPHVALEAVMSGLPVLLTTETGLSAALMRGMMLRSMKSPEEIASAILEAERTYGSLANTAQDQLPQRGIQEVADEFQKTL